MNVGVSDAITLSLQGLKFTLASQNRSFRHAKGYLLHPDFMNRISFKSLTTSIQLSKKHGVDECYSCVDSKHLVSEGILSRKRSLIRYPFDMLHGNKSAVISFSKSF